MLLDRLNRQIVQEIDRLQFEATRGTNCTSSKLFVITAWGQGFGGQLHYYTHHLFTATRLNRTLVIRRKWGYANGCPFNGGMYHDYRCFFKPLSDCFEDNSFLESELSQLDHLTQDPESRLISSAGEPDFFYSHLDQLEKYPPAYRQLGIPFYRSRYHLKQLHNMQPEVEALLAQRKKEVGWPPSGTPVIGVHIRRGDKFHETPERGVEEYLQGCLRLKKETGVRHVFLATDSPTLLKNILASPNWTNEFTLLHPNDSHPEGDTHSPAERIASQNENGYEWGLDALTSLHLLSEGNYMVLTGASNLGIVAAEWMYLKGNLLGPAIFLDLDKHPAKKPTMDALSVFNRTQFLESIWNFYHPPSSSVLPN